MEKLRDKFGKRGMVEALRSTLLECGEFARAALSAAEGEK